MTDQAYETPPGRPIRWGILGTGFIAAVQTQDLIANGFAVQAVGSRSLESSRSFCDKFGIPAALGGYEALVADPDVDVIYIATPHTFHHAHSLLALRGGKHVLVEKPFMINAQQAQDVVALAGARGLVVLEAMWTRFLPHMARIREIINDGTIGEVRKVIASLNMNLPKDPSHRINDPELGGGALLDLGIYPISFAFSILGAPARIRACASLTPNGVDRQTAVIFEYPDGQQALLDCTLDAAGANRAVIIGTKGWIDIGSRWYEATSFKRYGVDGELAERFEHPLNSRGMQFQAAEMERLIRIRATAGTTLPPSESISVMTAMDEIRKQIGLKYMADAGE